VKRAYFDASAIAKLIREERESLALVDFLDDPMEAVTSAISEIEVPRALRRHGVTAEDVAEALKGFIVVSVDAGIRARASALEPTTLRSLDALHLATALAIGTDGLHVVTYDDRLAQAAREQGLIVVQPGRASAGAGA
jgi:predicted nucleic acid-binding protein